jgi:hypothetical protein
MTLDARSELVKDPNGSGSGAFSPSTFDVVIDKATFDSVLVSVAHSPQCGENSLSNAANYLSQIHNVLKAPKEGQSGQNAQGGVYIVISYGTPENRECYLKKVPTTPSLTLLSPSSIGRSRTRLFINRLLILLFKSPATTRTRRACIMSTSAGGSPRGSDSGADGS